MQFHEAIRIYLICTLAEGFPRSTTSLYHHTLNMFLETVGDMEVTTLSPIMLNATWTIFG